MVGSRHLHPLEPRRLLTTVHFTVDPSQNVHPISRFIYGINQSFAGAYANDTFTRLGGNRWTAYNWENNASNAGSDFQYQNDGFLSNSNTPGAAVSPEIVDAANHNAGILVTVPMNGYVSADKSPGGDVRNSGSNYLQTRFKQELPAKGSAFTLTPSTTDAFVYEDEFINWVKTNYPYGQTDPNKPIWFDLDNEPDLWSSTHAEVHPTAATYSELINDSINYATAIKNVEPSALVYGGVNYGWNGYTSLQGATQDTSIKDTILNFQASYLKAMHAADQAAGRRLVDVLDMHWYPEAQDSNGVRITDGTTAASATARVQAPRSLWDPTYVEKSWITQDSLPFQPAMTPAQFKGDAIQLLPREQAIVNEYDLGAKISISEYNYGGGSDISGAIAEADVLGIFGQQGVFSANEWPLQSSEPYIAAGMNMFRNYDGANSTFGDTSISASTDDVADSSIYASTDSAHPGVITLVAINKSASSIDSVINLKGLLPLGSASVYRIINGSSIPQSAGTISITDPSNVAYTMLPSSVSTIRIQIAAPECRRRLIGLQLSIRAQHGELRVQPGRLGDPLRRRRERRSRRRIERTVDTAQLWREQYRDLLHAHAPGRRQLHGHHHRRRREQCRVSNPADECELQLFLPGRRRQSRRRCERAGFQRARIAFRTDHEFPARRFQLRRPGNDGRLHAARRPFRRDCPAERGASASFRVFRG